MISGKQIKDVQSWILKTTSFFCVPTSRTGLTKPQSRSRPTLTRWGWTPVRAREAAVDLLSWACLNPRILYSLLHWYFLDGSTAWCTNSSERGQAVLGRSRCCSTYAKAQSRPIRPRCLWKLFWKTRHWLNGLSFGSSRPSAVLETGIHLPASFKSSVGLAGGSTGTFWHLLWLWKSDWDKADRKPSCCRGNSEKRVLA